MIATTKTGSKYEIDLAGKRARRISGAIATMGHTKDGDWRSFSSIAPDPIQVGTVIVIVWEELDPTKIANGSFPITFTTPVASIELPN